MSLINDLRFDLGDVPPGTGLATVTLPVASIQEDSIVVDTRVDIGDINSSATGVVQVNLPTVTESSGVITDLRIDIGDATFTPSGVQNITVPISQIDLDSLISDLRADIGDGLEVFVPSGICQVNAPEVWGTHVVTTDSYTIQQCDVIVLVNPTVNTPVVIELPDSACVGQMFIIKDLKGSSSSYPITIDPGLNTIDGLDYFRINTNKQSITIVWSGPEWSII